MRRRWQQCTCSMPTEDDHNEPSPTTPVSSAASAPTQPSHSSAAATPTITDASDSAAEPTGISHTAGLVGVIIDGRYAIERMLGHGGMGQVFLAKDLQLHSRPVVIKLLLDEAYKDPYMLKKFQQEMEALSRIQHPGVIGIIDSGELPGARPFIVMEYIDGMNLRAQIRSEGMNLERTAEIRKQTGRALGAAHEKGIFHRDLKPENIMLQRLNDGDEQAKVIDFGIAKVKDSLMAPSTGTSLMVGTVLYMAPEQLEKRPVTSASDIYSLGIIAYEVLTGRRPFNPESIFQLLEMQRAGARVRPQDLRPSLPEEAQSTILRALSFNGADRHRKAQEFGDDLWRALNGQSGGYGVSTTFIDPAPSPIPAPLETLTAELKLSTAKGRIALLYKPHAQPDEQILSALEAELRMQGYDVFVDRHMSIGVAWAQEIERQVRTADAVIPLLSSASVSSEMLTYE